MPRPLYPRLSIAAGLGLGNEGVDIPGDLESMVGIEEGIALLLGLRRLEAEAREFMVLFDVRGDSSLRAPGPSLSFLEICSGPAGLDM